MRSEAVAVIGDGVDGVDRPEGIEVRIVVGKRAVEERDDLLW